MAARTNRRGTVARGRRTRECQSAGPMVDPDPGRLPHARGTAHAVRDARQEDARARDLETGSRALELRRSMPGVARGRLTSGDVVRAPLRGGTAARSASTRLVRGPARVSPRIPVRGRLAEP